MATKIFVDELGCNGRSKVLDLGCVCDTNIQFFVHLGCRVFVDDILQLNVQIPRGARAPDGAWVDRLLAELNYPTNFFDGILCWNLFDHLDPEGARRVSHKLWTIIKISGCALALFRPENPGPHDRVLRYRILNPGELVYETLPLPPLEGTPYHNRDIAGIVAPFSLGHSYRLKNGWREVVLRK